MKRIENLDKVLNHIYWFSKDLASIPITEMSQNTDIEIDELTEYIEELEKREFVNNYSNGSYITLKGRLAIENSKNKQPFKDELNSKKLKKYWTITKIIAGVLNAIIIIGIAVWAQTSSNKKDHLENELKILIEKNEIESSKQKATIDSLKSAIREIESVKTTNSSEIPQGTFIYELYFAEFGGRMSNSECRVIIKKNRIVVEQTEKTNLTGGKEMFRGMILKHKSGEWILTNNTDDVNADEIGGCTEIPIINLDEKLIEWC